MNKSFVTQNLGGFLSIIFYWFVSIIHGSLQGVQSYKTLIKPGKKIMLQGFAFQCLSKQDESSRYLQIEIQLHHSPGDLLFFPLVNSFLRSTH